MVIGKVNYVHSLEFAVRASAKTTMFQRSIETTLPTSVPNWQRSEEDPGLPSLVLQPTSGHHFAMA